MKFKGIILLALVALDCKTSSPDWLSGANVTIQNIRKDGVLQSGFIIGSTTTADGIEYAYDGGGFATATLTGFSWKAPIPIPSSGTVWRDNSQHTIQVRAKLGSHTSAPVSVTFRKGTNRDANGDGYADLAVGGQSGTGNRVYVFHSSGSAGISATSASSGSANTVISPDVAGDGLGNSLTWGDINGDGFADLVVAANTKTVGGQAASGAIYIFHSSGSSGIASTSATNASRTILSTPTLNQYFGDCVATGDVNGDGYADVATDQSGNPNTGTAYIFQSAGTSGVTITQQNAATRTIVGEAAGSFGIRLTLADINNDGFSDLIAGAHQINAGGFALAGAVYIFHSTGANGITITLASAATRKIEGTATNQFFGLGFGAADFNGDGIIDIAASAMGTTGGSTTFGRVLIFHGQNTTGISATNLSQANTTITNTTLTNLGESYIAVGDLNGDGFADLTIPERGHNGNQGRVSIFYSPGSSGFGASVAITQANATLLGESASDFFSSSTAIADFNGDGIADLVSSSNQYSALSNIGRVYVYHAPTSGAFVSGGATTANRTITGDGSLLNKFGFWVQ